MNTDESCEAVLTDLGCGCGGCLAHRPSKASRGGCDCLPRELSSHDATRLRSVLRYRQRQVDALRAELRRVRREAADRSGGAR